LSLSGQVRAIEKQVMASMRTIMPDVPAKRLKTGKKALQIMKGRISDYQSKVDLLTSGLKSITALDILREISSQIPNSIKVDVKEISIDRNKVSIKGDTDSFTSVDNIVTQLREFDKFTKVEKGAISDSPSGQSKRFTISIEVGDSKSSGQAKR
jgi:Tfp pilus assembly protein PilN